MGKYKIGTFGLSFPRRRESTQVTKMDTRLRGYDNFFLRLSIAKILLLNYVF